MINVIGMGYIGLPTALMLAAHGNEIVGSDNNIELIEKLREGNIPFEEKGIDELFSQAIQNGIRFSEEKVKADVYIIAVPTPYDEMSKKVDASYVERAVEEAADIAPGGAVLVIESTIAPGTIDAHIRQIIENKHLISGKDIHLVHAPERIIPGNMIYELRNNSRTIGADSAEIAGKIKEIYSTFCQGEITLTDIRTAEMTKVVENTYRDINIAYANELVKICRAGNLNVYEIIRIANKHPRVNILSPGPGVGGHCISVDPWFLVGDYPGLANIILAARKINDSMPEYVLERIQEIMEENQLRDITQIGFYGLTYKEDVDDVRKSPTLQLLECMKKHLAFGVKTYDPYVKKDIVENQLHDFDMFVSSCKLIAIMVAHTEIKEKIEKLRGKIVLDTKNICSLENTYKL
ncbi:MAG: nucleotide sugar dehydrogenase [Lachnospiraceae bacterium]|nr:nucleotide sugar dehydrogenase [Lachnospiraceae bacterium]